MSNTTDQTPINNLNEKEISLIQRTFKDNESLLKTIRALFFGLPMQGTEKDLIKSTFASDELRAVFKRRFLPELDANSPIGQVQDVWLGAEQMIFAQAPHVIEQAVLYKERSIEMIRKALSWLENPGATPVDFLAYSAKFNSDPLAIDLLARNQYIRHVETQLSFLWVIAQQPKAKPGDIHKNRTK